MCCCCGGHVRLAGKAAVAAVVGEEKERGEKEGGTGSVAGGCIHSLPRSPSRRPRSHTRAFTPRYHILTRPPALRLFPRVDHRTASLQLYQRPTSSHPTSSPRCLAAAAAIAAAAVPAVPAVAWLRSCLLASGVSVSSQDVHAYVYVPGALLRASTRHPAHLPVHPPRPYPCQHTHPPQRPRGWRLTRTSARCWRRACRGWT